MFVVPVKELLEAGVHFGCRASRWNPRMAPYIFGKRNLIHIIDLKQTLRGLIRATAFLQRLVTEGHQVLFVGTKRQAQDLIPELAASVEMPFVSERWLGGTLTNFSTIRSRLRRLEELEALEADGQMDSMAKKRKATLMREKRKIHRNLNGLRSMDKLPGAVVIVDPRREHNAVKEASKLGIPVISILDTDCDPLNIDVPIPGNDDSVRSISILLKKLVEAVAAGRTAYSQWLLEEERRRQDDERQKAEEQKKLDEARQRREEERAALKAAQERLRRERETEEKAAQPAEPPPEAKLAQADRPKPAKAQVPAGPDTPEPAAPEAPAAGGEAPEADDAK